MAVTAALTAPGAAVGWAEYGVWASLLAAGAAVAFGIRGPVLVSIGVVAAFAAFHGVLHGAEAAAGARAEFLGGMWVAAAGLHAVGAVMARAAALAGGARKPIGPC